METLSDTFRFLEERNDPRTQAWTAEQNARTRALLDALPGRRALLARLDPLLAIDWLATPVERGGRVFGYERRWRADQAVLSVREAGVQRTLLDPAQLDPTGLTALDWWVPSPFGTYVACGLSTNGDERSTLHLLDTARAAFFGETIPGTRHASIAWLPDERGFFYTRLPPGDDYRQQVYLHAFGADPSEDRLVFGAGRPPEDTFVLRLSHDGRTLVVSVERGWAANDVYVADLRGPEPFAFRPIVEGRDALYDVRPYGDRLLIRTNEDAPRFRLALAEVATPEPAHWRDFVAEEPDASLEDVALARGGLALAYLRDVVSTVRVRLDDGRMLTLDANDLGAAGAFATVFGLSAHEASPDVFVRTVGFLEPPATARVTLGPTDVAIENWARAASPLDPAAYRIEQCWFVSKDGTRVPMFVLSAKTTARDGSAPTVLHGYGGFNVALTPTFQPSLVPWLDAGGVYAIANLRGGSEFGEDWHRAGMFEKKQNVFDDFIAATEFLASSRLADPKRIGIAGGSNGGLLVATVEVQRPELFAAVLCAVPLTDMLRYPDFLIARLWIPEYGDPAIPEQAAYLRAYSPYHNVRDGVAYPATFIVTAESDSRVDPMHARKFGARLQEATSGNAPILVYVEANAGHGAGKPRHKQLDELADRWSFFGRALGVPALSG